MSVRSLSLFLCTRPPHTHTRTHTHTHVCMNKCTYVRTSICTYIHTYIHAYIHTYIWSSNLHVTFKSFTIKSTSWSILDKFNFWKELLIDTCAFEKACHSVYRIIKHWKLVNFQKQSLWKLSTVILGYNRSSEVSYEDLS